MEYQDADHKTQQCQRQLTDQPEKQEIKGECKNEDELNKVRVLGENGLCCGNVKRERETGSGRCPKLGLKLRSLEAQLHMDCCPQCHQLQCK